VEEEAVVGVEVAAPEGRRESQPLGYDWIKSAVWFPARK